MAKSKSKRQRKGKAKLRVQRAALLETAAQAEIDRLGGIEAVRAETYRRARQMPEREWHVVTWQPAGGRRQKLRVGDLVARAELDRFRAEVERRFSRLVVWRAVPLAAEEERCATRS